MTSHFATSAVELSQADFLNKSQANEIAQAAIKTGGQPPVTISGTYFKTDADGRLTKEEVPFVVHNAWLKQNALNATGKNSCNPCNSCPGVVKMISL